MRRRHLTPSVRRFRASTALALSLPVLALLGSQPAAAQGALPGGNSRADTLLEADTVDYDQDGNTVIASGHVQIARDGSVLLADRVAYDQGRDVITATGNVTLIEPNGSSLFVDRIDVTSDLKQAIATDLRILLSDKSRMTARAFRRVDQTTDELYEGAYTACDVCAEKAPLWKIEAKHVERNAEKRMVYYHDVWLDFMGVPVLYSPYLAHPDPTAGRKSGFLMPSIGGGSNLGLSFAEPYYINIAPDKDATLEPLVTTAAGKGMIAEYRQEFQHGRLKMYGSGVGGDPATSGDFRGHIASWARWDIDDNWRSGTDINLASDQTYLRRYNFDTTAATWLTTSAFVERFSRNSYFAATSYYFQRQRDIIASPSPVISPLMAYNYTTDPLPWGGYLKFDANAVVLTREKGNDSNRLSGTVSYDLPFTTGGGHVFNARVSYRADGYYVTDYMVPTTGKSFTGTVGRARPEASLEWRYPLSKPSTNFTQVLEPIVMVYTSPIGKNPDRIPNEDSLDFEFDDTNLFEPQRFTGFDRVEGGSRVSYALHWSAYNTRGGTIDGLIGQSYRFNRQSPFPALSGLDTKLSDYVGRIDVSPNQYLSLQYRFRLDEKTLTSRRNEVTASMGPDVFRLTMSYIDIKQTPNALLNPLDRPKELYTAVSTKLSQYWRVSASHRHNLGLAGGAIRTDLLLQYEDECFATDLTIARDNTSDRDFRSGIQILLRFSLKTIGDLRLNTTVGRP